MMNVFFILLKQELVLAVILFLLLMIKLGSKERSNTSTLTLVQVLLLVNLAAGFIMPATGSLFGGMFVTDALIVLEKNILNLGLLVVSMMAWPWLLRHKHVTEFYLLLLSATLGMFFMLSSHNLLMFYLGLEMFTIPLAALANFDLDRKTSGEAAMKMIISSAFSSGLLLFGISLLYGATGTLQYGELSQLLHITPLVLFGFVLVMAGFGFKISAVPFHLWTADVYEGAPVAVTAYLSVLSKGAVLFVLVPVLYKVFAVLAIPAGHAVFILAVATMIIGNLFALRQQNIKRFLAFSSIAQVGFILAGLSGQADTGGTAVIYFVLVYLFSNLGAFGVVALVSACSGKEAVDDYKGFYRTNPALSWVLALSLFSLAGIPPLAGFFGKFFLLLAAAGKGNYTLVIVAALNMVVALYYYLRIVRAMFMEDNAAPIARIRIGPAPGLALVICVAGMLVTGLLSGAYEYIYRLVTAQAPL